MSQRTTRPQGVIYFANAQEALDIRIYIANKHTSFSRYMRDLILADIALSEQLQERPKTSAPDLDNITPVFTPEEIAAMQAGARTEQEEISTTISEVLDLLEN